MNLSIDDPKVLLIAGALALGFGYIFQTHTDPFEFKLSYLMILIMITGLIIGESTWDKLKYDTPKFVGNDVHGTILQEDEFGIFSVFRLGGVTIKNTKIPLGKEKEKTVVVPRNSVIRLGENYMTTVKLHPNREITSLPPSLTEDLIGMGFKFTDTVHFGTLEQEQMTDENKKFEDIFLYHNMLVNLDGASIKSQSGIVKRFLASYQAMEDVANQSVKVLVINGLLSIGRGIKRIEPRFWIYMLLIAFFILLRNELLSIKTNESWVLTTFILFGISIIYASTFFVYERSSQFISHRVFGCLKHPNYYGSFALIKLDVPDYVLPGITPKRIVICPSLSITNLGQNYASGGHFKRVTYKQVIDTALKYDENGMSEKEALDLLELVERNRSLLKSKPIWLATGNFDVLDNRYTPIITRNMLKQLGIEDLSDLEQSLRRIHEQFRNRIKLISQTQEYASEKLKSTRVMREVKYPPPEEEEG